jgi:hypothetical protein
MKDYLLDLVEHTHALGIIDLVKIVGTDTETEFGAYAEDKTVVISGSFKTPIPEFAGTFGMPNLAKLKTIIGFDDYDDNAKINLIREDRDGEKDVPVRIHFETATGDFVNDYRLMLKYIVEERVNNVKFKGVTWDVEFEPTNAGISRLKKQASANSEEVTFNIKTENGDLKIYFGDPSTHSGNFVFQPNVTGTLTRSWNWPVKVFLAIMDLPGDKKIRMADAGAVEIVVDSGLAMYRYLLPAQAK